MLLLSATTPNHKLLLYGAAGLLLKEEPKFSVCWIDFKWKVANGWQSPSEAKSFSLSVCSCPSHSYQLSPSAFSSYIFTLYSYPLCFSSLRFWKETTSLFWNLSSCSQTLSLKPPDSKSWKKNPSGSICCSELWRVCIIRRNSWNHPELQILMINWNLVTIELLL